MTTSRRRLQILLAAICLSGAIPFALVYVYVTLGGTHGSSSTASRTAAPHGPVRTDQKPLLTRFPALGHPKEMHWQGWDPGAGGWIPGPTDTRIAAVITLQPKDVEHLRSTYAWTAPGSEGGREVNPELRPFMPTPVSWQTSDEFESNFNRSGFHGTAVFDADSGTIFLELMTD